jgi:HEAT repeats
MLRVTKMSDVKNSSRIKQSTGTTWRRVLAMGGGCLLWAGGAAAQSGAAAAPVAPAQQHARAAAPLTSKGRAWQILHEGVKENSVEKRAKAVNALGTLAGNAEAEIAATKALTDDKFQVRVAAAMALGSMQAARAIPELEKALDDVEPTVILAAANSLMSLKDSTSAYDIYYGVLTGGMRTNRGLVQEQLKTLHDSKKLAELGIQEGVGFVPFGGVSYAVVKTVMQSDQSMMRAIAAKKLAHDPDPVSAAALVVATQDKSAMVRVAAVQALAERGDKAQLPNVVLAMDDDKDEVRYNAAACVIRLNEVSSKRRGVSAGIAGAKAASAPDTVAGESTGSRGKRVATPAGSGR